MERKSVDSQVGSSTSFKTAQEAFGSVEKTNRPSPVPSGHFTPTREESQFISDSSWEITPKPTYRHIEESSAASQAEEPEPKPKPRPQTPEFKKHWSAFVPSQPIPIPGAVPKRRVATMQEDGTLAVVGSTAPRTEKELEDMEKEEARDRALAEKYERMKADMMKWHEDNKRFIPGHVANKKSNSQASNQSSSQSGNQATNWARKSIGRFREILSAGRVKDVTEKSVSADDPAGPPPPGLFRIGETPSLTGDEVPNYQHKVLQPFSSPYGRTTATIAYEGLKTEDHKEGSKPLKSTAFKEGYMAGLAQARKEKEYKLGYQAGLTAYDSPYDAKPIHGPLPWEKQSRPSIMKRKDGSAIARYELVGEVSKLMDNLGLERVDDEDQTEGSKGKGVLRPRRSWEVAEFIKDVAYEIRFGA
ncbi:hypothetical protein F5Y14DRAFT_457254 [Nemania sp. NC0429]|nr:hypothetical protein F5Y14DRAFT_457254 [Nemania sp. NC0429]